MSRTDDLVALRALADAYSTAVTLRDAQGITDVFTETAEWSVGAPMDLHLAGNQTIGQGIAAGLGAYDFMVQMIHSVSIDLHGDSAVVRCIVQEMGRRADGSAGMSMLGLYDDEAVRTATGWRFARRRFRPIYLDHTIPTGLAFPLD